MDVLLVLWERVCARQAPLPGTTALLTILTAALFVLVPALWRRGRHVVTIAHEGGHALVATLSGRRLGGIRLHSDTSGLTVSRGRPRGFGMILTLLAGYTAPALLGLGSAVMLGAGYASGLLWLLLVALTLILVQIRNWFGLWSVLVSGTLILAITWFGTPLVQGIGALMITAFLLLGGVRTALELQVSRSRRGGLSSDADQLARLTHIPGAAWATLFVLVAVLCVALAVRVLQFTA
ncbi:M50 family metallopeptidase [Cryobacterium sp. PH31-AA6]|uniref:M50 family metallopeptidase n=1 Tax=Cryobacterium sp. PH31-AA6 TaxID=3046205 RepID=UPI0024B8FF1D|nr:M50 family metallopeptidase [Cryobacterium sp. PH31-AA6]MDJ0325391.1 M50 family metallopeptidase [Cryobacterium sp. PH31-AA6]